MKKIAKVAVTPCPAAHGESVNLPDLPAAFVLCKKSVAIGFFRLDNRCFDSVPLFKRWNSDFVNESIYAVALGYYRPLTGAAEPGWGAGFATING